MSYFGAVRQVSLRSHRRAVDKGQGAYIEGQSDPGDPVCVGLYLSVPGKRVSVL